MVPPQLEGTIAVPDAHKPMRHAVLAGPPPSPPATGDLPGGHGRQCGKRALTALYLSDRPMPTMR